jgi:hypothetical protein
MSILNKGRAFGLGIAIVIGFWCQTNLAIAQWNGTTNQYTNSGISVGIETGGPATSGTVLDVNGVFYGRTDGIFLGGLIVLGSNGFNVSSGPLNSDYTGHNYYEGQLSIGTPTGEESLKIQGNTRLGQAPTTMTTLASAMGSGDTTATVGATAGYPSTGTLIIDSNEAVTYTGITSTTFTGLTRGALGTTAVSHTSGTAVHNLLLTAVATSTTPKVVVTGAGNVGIGNIFPAYPLDVNGHINTSDGITAAGALSANGITSTDGITASGVINASASGIHFSNGTTQTAAASTTPGTAVYLCPNYGACSTFGYPASCVGQITTSSICYYGASCGSIQGCSSVGHLEP